MEVKNLLGKLHTDEGDKEKPTQNAAPPTPPPSPRRPQPTAVEDRVPQRPAFDVPINHAGGRPTMREDLEEGIILDLGEGISLNIPIQKRMSLSDFIKLAEKVKALEMLSEGNERYERGQY